MDSPFYLPARLVPRCASVIKYMSGGLSEYTRTSCIFNIQEVLKVRDSCQFS